MAPDLQLGQKLGMSLDDLIKKTQQAKKKAPPKKTQSEKKSDKKKPAGSKKTAKAKPVQNAKGKRPNKPAEHQPKTGGAIKKNTAKKPTRATLPNAPKRTPANPRTGSRNAQASQTRVGDLLNMNVAVSSKRDAQAAMKIAKQLEAEARKYLGTPAPIQRQQQQQRGVARPQERQPVQPRPAPRQRMQQPRVPYSVAETSLWPAPETENFLADHDRMSDRDSEQMDMDMDDVDMKPNLASLQAQATQFARGVRGQSRR